jgi:plastocyanin
MRRLPAGLALLVVPFAVAPSAEAIEFGGSVGSAYSPSTVRIHPGGSVTWTGDFGMHPLRSAAAAHPFAHDGAVGVTESFSEAFPAAGVVRFHCAVHGFKLGDNQVTGMSGQVVVTDNTPPTAAFSATATRVASGTWVGFDGRASSDAEGPVTYAWDLDDDGAFDDGTGATAERVYSSPDGETTVVEVRLRVTDGNADAVGPERDVVSHELTVVGASDAGGSPGGPGVGDPVPGPGTGSPAADTRAPVPALHGRKLAVRRHRIGIRLSADEAGRATVTLRARGRTLARGSGPVGTTARTLALRLTPAGRRRLAHGRRVAGRLTVTVRDAAGNGRTLRRAVTVRG